MLNIRVIKVGLLGTNCSIISNGEKVIVIDPGASFGKIDAALNGKKIDYVLLTHGHFDHIGALEEIIKKYNPIVYCHINSRT